MDEVLNFEPTWYIQSTPGWSSRRNVEHGIQWVSMHRHPGTKQKDGWYVTRGECCSRCRAKFPTYLIGMMNMMNGLEPRR